MVVQVGCALVEARNKMEMVTVAAVGCALQQIYGAVVAGASLAMV